MARISTEEAREQARELNYSRPFSLWKVSSHPGVERITGPLFQEFSEWRHIRPQDEDKARQMLTAVCLDLFAAYESDPRTFLAYSRNKNDYSAGSRYQPTFLSFRLMVALTDFLSERGWTNDALGMRSPGWQEGRRSRMRATDALIGIFRAEGVALEHIEEDQAQETIILRDSSKNEIYYEDTEQTHVMRERLKAINSCLKDHCVLLEISDAEFDILAERVSTTGNSGNQDRQPIDFSRVTLKRVFNNSSFEAGGRFYGGFWQNIPREYRKFITINDKYTSELDYSGLHINMLYAIEGLPLPEDDPYTLPGHPREVRNLLKRAMLTLVNADSEDDAIKAVRRNINFGDYGGTRSTDEAIKPILEAFIVKHDPIRNHFYRGIGTRLQYLDSQLAEYIMLYFAKENLAALPMHDSFIVFCGYEEELKECMDRIFYEMFSQHCEIKPKETTRNINYLYDLGQEEYRRQYTKYLQLLGSRGLI